MSRSGNVERKALVVRPDEGREYDMGRMRAVFFADGDPTVSERMLRAGAMP